MNWDICMCDIDHSTIKNAAMHKAVPLTPCCILSFVTSDWAVLQLWLSGLR